MEPLLINKLTAHPLAPKQEKAVLVGLITPQQSIEQLTEYLDELAFLTATAGAQAIGRFTQKVEAPNPKTFIGKGKMEEIKVFVVEQEVDMVVFDDELSPSQLRNIERMLDCKILDRSNLILDIFAKRARTSHARTQVELAQYQYLLPRLTRMWTHLSRQKGGIGMRGPGETEIETDRRIIRDKISLLKEKLKRIDKQMATQRKNRGQLVRVALVGYTNVGKSTLMNRLSKSDVFAENKLFATLDTTVRKVVVENLPFLLSDTVGFIRKLPHHLIESFKSTLDEVRESDVLLHVVDIAHPNFEEHIATVNETLTDIGAIDKPTFMIFNKIDAYTHVVKDEDDLAPKEKHHLTLEELKTTWMAQQKQKCIFVSVIKNQNIDALRELLYKEIRATHLRIYPHQLLY
jgi:GTP-binding protein HflX